MKKILILTLIAALCGVLPACHEADKIYFEQQGQINFTGWNSSGYPGDAEAVLQDKTNFGLLGENVTEKTLRVGVRVMGAPVDYDRPVAVKVVTEDGATIQVDKIEGENYFVPAGEYKAEFRFKVRRPAERNVVYKGKLVFDFDAMEDFTPGAVEKGAFVLEYSDVVNKEILNVQDELWNYYSEEFGILFGWSETKARFIITHLGITDFNEWLYDDFEVYFGCMDLQEILDEYRSDPSNPPLYDETLLPEQVWIEFM